MKLKTCKVCGGVVNIDKKSGKYWCVRCKEVRDEYDEKYRIVVMGKNGGKESGRYNFINCIGKALERMGHEVIGLSDDYLYKIVPQYDFVECFHYKKPINIKQIQYEFDPDFILIEQMYYRLDVSEITCPVIYQHREYTHFPDIIDPDILLASYHWRLEVFEFYHPYEYKNIPYKEYLYVAVDTELVKPVEEKSLDGITHIYLKIPMWQFRNANGPFGDAIMEQQEIFWDNCVTKQGCRGIPVGLGQKDFLTMLGRCEALLYDAGRFAGVSRRLFEAMASKTLCVIRVYSTKQMDLYERLGLTDEMCIFVWDEEDVGRVKFTEEERKEKVEKAYKWVIENHTYDVRARELLTIIDNFNSGMRTYYRFMGWALKHKVEGILAGEVYLK